VLLVTLVYQAAPGFAPPSGDDQRSRETKESSPSVAQNGSQTGTLVSGVARRYASALFELAQENRSIDAVARDLDAFERLIDESADLRRLIKSPVFTADEQVNAVGAILERAGVGGLAGNFIRLVASKRRLFSLPEMIKAFRVLVAEAKGIVPAEVRLAEEPSPKVLDDIEAALREVAKAEVALDVKIDPSLIGGLVVRLGHRMVDASLRTKLNAIRLAMRDAR
jgi:F-type H+-transporting ATPase subunit delta